MEVLRFDDSEIISTDLNPLEDMLNFFMSIRSVGYTSELLHQVHHFQDKKEIKSTAKLISLHIDNAIGLANQGLDGVPQTSFLPLYYSALNFSKAYLLFAGRKKELLANKRHGAAYDEKQMKRDFLNEQIKIYSKGTIPLLYKTMLGKEIDNSGCIQTIDEIYKSIISIGAEYSTITKRKSGLLFFSINIIEDSQNGHYIKIDIAENFHENVNPVKIRAFLGVSVKGNNNTYVSQRIKGDFDEVKIEFLNKINRNLFSWYVRDIDFIGPHWYNVTPLSGKKHVFNEEMNILLAYFHLSNIIRYNPEHLYKLMDSKYWVILLGLRKHGFLRFLKLMWGNINKSNFESL